MIEDQVIVRSGAGPAGNSFGDEVMIYDIGKKILTDYHHKKHVE
jgi:hypothetical protein